MDASDSGLVRRTVLKSALGALALPAVGSSVLAAAPRPRESPALVVLYLNGGPPGLFNSASSFLSKGAFGVTAQNVRSIGNGLLVDSASIGNLPAAALGHMAAINFKHGIYRHDLARASLLQTGSRSNLLMLAQAMGTAPAPIRCAVVNSLGLPVGVDASPPAEGGITLEKVVDLRSIAFTVDPANPSPSARQIAAAYQVDAESTTISDLKTTLLAAELLLRTGSSVVFAQPAFIGRPDRQFDTHEDTSGVRARQIMGSIIPEIRTFIARALEIPGRNVVIALFGEFSRTVDTSDHEPGGTATVIGKFVKTGTAGPLTPDGSPPINSPPPAGLWAYLAAALKVEEHPFGVNPNPELVV